MQASTPSGFLHVNSEFYNKTEHKRRKFPNETKKMNVLFECFREWTDGLEEGIRESADFNTEEFYMGIDPHETEVKWSQIY